MWKSYGRPELAGVMDLHPVALSDLLAVSGPATLPDESQISGAIAVDHGVAGQMVHPGANQCLDETKLVVVVYGECLRLRDHQSPERAFVEPARLQAPNELGSPDVEVAVDTKEGRNILAPRDAGRFGEQALQGAFWSHPHSDPQRVEDGLRHGNNTIGSLIERVTRMELAYGAPQDRWVAARTGRLHEDDRVVQLLILTLGMFESVTDDSRHRGVVARKFLRTKEGNVPAQIFCDGSDLGVVRGDDGTGDFWDERRTPNRVADQRNAAKEPQVLAWQPLGTTARGDNRKDLKTQGDGPLLSAASALCRRSWVGSRCIPRLGIPSMTCVLTDPNATRAGC